MKKSIFTFKSAALTIALALVFSSAAWARGNQAQTTGSALPIVSGFSMSARNQEALDATPWFTAWVQENLGIRLESRSTAPGNLEQYVNTLVASNDMPDLFNFRDPTVIQNIVNSGKMLNLAKYKDKLPNLFNNPVYATAIRYYQDNYGGSDGGLYCIPFSIGVGDQANPSVDIKTWMRYDWYKEIGSPPINTLEDYLPVIKQIMDRHPTNADGEKMYGMALWTDWDKQSAAPVTYLATTFGYDVEYVSHLAQTYIDGTRTPISILDDNGPYKRVLKFYYTANQMGLLDPNSATQNFDQAAAKSTAGRVIFQNWDWFGGFNSQANKDAGIGFMPVPRKDQKSTMIDIVLPTGASDVMGVPANTKNLDAVLKFLNWYVSWDAHDMMYNGPRGLIWDVGSDGLRYITDAGWTILAENNEKHVFGDPGGFMGGILNGSMINPNTNQALTYYSWKSSILHSNNNKLYNTWVADHSGQLPNDWMVSQGMTVQTLAATRMMPALPTDLENIMTQIGDVVKTNSWRAIFARNEAEFDAFWQDAQTKAAGLGMQRLLDWTIQAWEQAKAAEAKYK
jgi:putative aldouronate transport system substrate-binding protein